MHPNHEAFLKEIEPKLGEMLETDGEIPPIIFPYWLDHPEENNTEALQFPKFTDTESKKTCNFMIQLGVAKFKPSLVIFCCEAWSVTRKAGEPIHSVAEQPDRVECVVLAAEEYKGDRRIGTAKIVRFPNMKPMLDKIEWCEGIPDRDPARFKDFFKIREELECPTNIFSRAKRWAGNTIRSMKARFTIRSTKAKTPATGPDPVSKSTT